MTRPRRRRLPARRTVLKAGLIGVPTIAAGSCGALGWLYATADANTAGKVHFTNRLAIPPMVAGKVDPKGRRVFDLRAAAGPHQFSADVTVEGWGINQNYLGPTLRAERGETVVVNFRNDLPESTTIHWHGMHLPAQMDGTPHRLVERGTTWSPTWRINQPAATLWYHPHPHERTRSHVNHGLAGIFIVDERTERGGDASGLPSRYGVDDIPLIVQDRRFRDDLLAEANLADQVCVNGTLAPYLDVRTQRIRLRLLNASNARIYHFGFTDDRTFDLVGTDGGLLGAAHPTSRIQLSPAERAEIVVTMRPSERIVLRSYPPELQTGSWSNRFAGGDDMFDILELRAAAALAPSPSLPGRLADTPHLDTTTVAATRRFELKLPKINGQSMDMNRIDTAVLKNSTEIWEIENRDSEPHNFHIHDVQFVVLSIAGAPPPPELTGWKDTIYTPPKTPVRLAVRFTDYADPDTPYMYHCHLLRHEDKGLMGQFVVLEPGQQPGKPSGHHHR